MGKNEKDKSQHRRPKKKQKHCIKKYCLHSQVLHTAVLALVPPIFFQIHQNLELVQNVTNITNVIQNITLNSYHSIPEIEQANARDANENEKMKSWIGVKTKLNLTNSKFVSAAVANCYLNTLPLHAIYLLVSTKYWLRAFDSFHRHQWFASALNRN